VSDIKFPLGLSVAGHGLCLALLIMFLPAAQPPVPMPTAMGGIEVVLAALPKPEEPPPQAETPPPPVEPPPPEPQPAPQPDEPVAAIEPPPPAPVAPASAAEPPPPAPHKPVVKPPPKPVVRHVEQPQPTPAFAPAQPTPAPAQVAPQQTALAPTPVPAPVPSPVVSPGYLGLLSAWLESHKHYPDSARQRGEEGRAVLHFDVDRNGRVLDFAVVKSSGYPDLDAAIEDMMRGATLPPFPAGMTESPLPVSVTIRFSLTR
jgi:periplasmic protein TonB